MRHLLAVGIDDALDLRGRQNFFPLAGASLAEKPLGFFRAFAEAVFFFLFHQLLKGRTLDRIVKLAQPLWHVNGQFRYGAASKTNTANGAFGSGPTPITLNGSQNLREDHWLVDFGIGRDFGLGSNAMWTLGVRIADLCSKLNINGTTTVVKRSR